MAGLDGGASLVCINAEKDLRGGISLLLFNDIPAERTTALGCLSPLEAFHWCGRPPLTARPIVALAPPKKLLRFQRYGVTSSVAHK